MLGDAIHTVKPFFGFGVNQVGTLKSSSPEKIDFKAFSGTNLTTWPPDLGVLEDP